jgi:hypothetical protein
VGLIFAASNSFVFLVFGFGGVGYVLKQGIEDLSEKAYLHWIGFCG